MPAFEGYVGIDYSGAQTPRSSLKGLRVYEAQRILAWTPHGRQAVWRQVSASVDLTVAPHPRPHKPTTYCQE